MAAGKTLMLLTVLFPLVLAKPGNKTCPDNWVPLNVSCVWIAHSKRPYWGAAVECERRGGDLIYIHSGEENYELAGMLMDERIESVWLGLNDLGVRKVYKWQGGQKVMYTNFAPGEAYSRKRQPRECVTMTVGNHSMWNSEYCFEHFHFVCRMDLFKGA